MELTRGDTGQYKFKRLDAQGHAITNTPDSLDFTVKNSFSDSDIVFQKKLADMTMDEDGTWHFTIDPADTEKLPVGNYVFDIEVKQDNYVQTIAKGTLKLTSEATWYNNR